MTGGSCHSAARRRSASSPFHMMECAYTAAAWSVPSEGWRNVAVRAPHPVRNDVYRATGSRRGAQRPALSTDWQPDDLITES